MNIVKNAVLKPPQLPLSIVAKAASACSLRKINPNYYGALIRVRDTTDNSEMDIYHQSYGGLAEDALQAFLQRNRVVSPNMDTDTSGDGIVDDWVDFVFDAGVIGTHSVELNSQKTTITSVGARFKGKGVETLNFISVLPNQTITLSIDAKISYIGTMRAAYYVLYYNSSGGLVANANAPISLTNDADFTKTTIDLIVPSDATITKLKIRWYHYDDAVTYDSTGSAWFKNASLKITNASAKVVTWYDQSGNGINFTQSTASYQPTIVSSGTIYTVNGRPAIYFNRSNTEYLNSTADTVTMGLDNGAEEYNSITKSTIATEAQVIVSNSVETSYHEVYINSSIGPDAVRVGFSGGSTGIGTRANTYNKTIIASGRYDGSAIYARFNTVDSAPTIRAFAAKNSTLVLGKRVSGVYYNGYMMEVIAYPGVLTTLERNALELNQARHYSMSEF